MLGMRERNSLVFIRLDSLEGLLISKSSHWKKLQLAWHGAVKNKRKRIGKGSNCFCRDDANNRCHQQEHSATAAFDEGSSRRKQQQQNGKVFKGPEHQAALPSDRRGSGKSMKTTGSCPNREGS